MTITCSSLLLQELHALLLTDILVLMEKDISHDRFLLRTHTQIDFKGGKEEVWKWKRGLMLLKTIKLFFVIVHTAVPCSKGF